MSTDLKDFFLATPMEGDEFMKVKYKHLPKDIRIWYRLKEKLTSDVNFFIRIKRGMYGLKQAAILAYTNLQKNLLQYGYNMIVGTVELWEHKTLPTKC